MSFINPERIWGEGGSTIGLVWWLKQEGKKNEVILKSYSELTYQTNIVRKDSLFKMFEV